MKLTKNELIFIKEAAYMAHGVYDYENNNDEEFKGAYGLTKKETYTVSISLRKKAMEELKKYNKNLSHLK